MRYVILALLFVTGCVTPHIEDRCLVANLDIKSLQIEDTLHGESHAKVECKSKK